MNAKKEGLMEKLVALSSAYLPLVSFLGFLGVYVIHKLFYGVENVFHSSPLLALLTAFGQIILIVVFCLALLAWFFSLVFLFLKGKKEQISKFGLIAGVAWILILIDIFVIK